MARMGIILVVVWASAEVSFNTTVSKRLTAVFVVASPLTKKKSWVLCVYLGNSVVWANVMTLL